MIIISRRTADVRSVGYSELFSLSREDVLAAMKDYPEAQVSFFLPPPKLFEERRVYNRIQLRLGFPLCSLLRGLNPSLKTYGGE